MGRIAAKSAVVIAILLAWGAGVRAQSCDLCYYAHRGDMAGVIAAFDRNAPVNASYQNTTPLFYAAIERHEDIALLLLQHGADPNTANGEGWTPLAIAAEQAELRLAEALLEHGATVDPPGAGNMTPLMLAAMHPDNTAMMRLLLSHGANANARSSNNQTAMNIATQAGWMANAKLPYPALDFLLAYGAKPNERDFWEPIAFAVKGKNAEDKQLLGSLLTAGADPNRWVSDGYPKEGRPLLFYAALLDDPDYTLLLLKAGADWKWLSSDGVPMILLAACHKGGERIRLMAAHGVDFTLRDREHDSMANYTGCQRRDPLMALVDSGVYLDGEKPREGYSGVSPLYWAVSRASADDVRMFLDAGADVPSLERPGDNPLLPDPQLLFVANNLTDDTPKVLQLLIDYGVDVLAKDSKGQTVLESFDAHNADKKTDPRYQQARAVLESAVSLRMITNGFLAAVGDEFMRAWKERQTEVVKKIFLEALPLYRRDPSSLGLRYLMLLSGRVLHIPAPADAEAHESAALAAYAKAQRPSDMLAVAAEYESALRAAPWAGAYYKNLCTVYELSGSYGRAWRHCYMWAAGGDNGDEAQLRIQRLREKIAKASYRQEQ